uniref:Uncharacterized protein n=1 Tax=Glossina pallidipes TaxID=7398 RepID=A0A1B0A7C2_GLOPL
MADKSVVEVYIFNHAALIVRDSDLVKSIPVKDFTYFSNRYGICDSLRAYNVFLSNFNNYLFPPNMVIERNIGSG